MPLSVVETAYQFIQYNPINPDCDLHQGIDFDPYTSPSWDSLPSLSHDFLLDILPSDEASMKFMASYDKPWEDMRHCASFPLDLENMEEFLQNSGPHPIFLSQC